MNEISCPIILSESPASDDEFSGGGHLRVARSIAALIKNGGRETPRIISLEGGVGSGKSTVIKLLKSKCDLPATTDIFIFDCFKHQNGPLRRAFVEEFCEFLKDEVFKSDNDLKIIDEKRNVALGRLTTVDRKSNTSIKFSAIAFLLALPLSSSGITSAFKLWSDESDSGKSHATALTVSVFVAILPAFILLVAWLCNRRKKDWSIGKLFTSNSDNTITELHSISSNVTSTDLSKYFSDLLQIYPDKRNLLIVLDNIDRLSANKLFDVWSDIEIFADYEADRKNKTWIIVPYDTTQIVSAFGVIFKDSAPDKGQALAQEFINKRFPIRHRVPPLLLSDWKNFFEINWRKALPTHTSPDEIHGVIKLFETYHPSKGQFTPRNIKHFINDVATAISCSLDESDARIITAYQLIVRLNGVAILNFFSNTGFDYAHKQLQQVSKTWQGEIAAIHFGVNPDLASEVLLRQPLLDAIGQRNKLEYNNLIKVYGAEDLVESILESEPSVEAASNIIICHSAAKTATADGRLISAIRRTLYHLKWAPTINIGEYIDALQLLLPETYTLFLDGQYRQLIARLDDVGPEDASHFHLVLANIDAMLPFVSQEVKDLKANTANSFFVDQWPKRSGALENVSLPMFIDGNDRAISLALSCMIKPEESAELLLEISGHITEFDEGAGLDRIPDKVAQESYARLIAKAGLLTDYYFLALSSGGGKQHATSILSGIASDPTLSFIPPNILEKVKPALLAALIRHEAVAAQSGNISGWAGQVKFDNDFKLLIRPGFSYHTLYQQWVGTSIAYLGSMLICSIEEKWSNLLFIQHFIKSYDGLRKLYDENPDHKIGNLWAWYNNWITPIAKELLSEEAHKGLSNSFLSDFLNKDNPSHQKVRKLVIANIQRERSDTTWAELLKSPYPSLIYGADISDDNSMPQASLLAALQASAKSISEGSLSAYETSFLQDMLRLLSKNNQNKIGLEIRQILYKTSQAGFRIDITDELLEVWGNYIANPIPLNREEREGLVKMISGVVASSDETITGAWLDSHARIIAGDHGWSDTSDLREIVIGSIKEALTNSIIRPLTGEFRERFEITLPNSDSVSDSVQSEDTLP